jgi:opacity protein-like surface antigen
MIRRRCVRATLVRFAVAMVESSWRLAVLVAVGHALAGAGSAFGQTVLVRNGPPGAAVDLVMNAAEVDSATADVNGHATLSLRLPGGLRDETAVAILVDSCDARRRVVFVERGRSAPPVPAGCTRQSLGGVFVLRPVSTVVVDVAPPRSRVLLRQGAFDPDLPPRVWDESPSGLNLFGSGGFTWIGNAGTEACGISVPTCSSEGSGVGYGLGAAFWFRPFFAAEATWLRPAEMTAEGSGTAYRFTSSLDARVVTMSAVLGIPSGPVRIYGKGGANYHQGLLTTTQTVDDQVRSIDGVEQTIAGASQVFERRTGGWGWQVGGGAEFWPNRWVAVFGEFGWTKLRGGDLDGGEAVMDDRVVSVMFGARVRVGR